MKTTAQLRREAYEAEGRAEFALAAKLYREAVAAYPSHHEASQLAAHDKARLESNAINCELAA